MRSIDVVGAKRAHSAIDVSSSSKKALLLSPSSSSASPAPGLPTTGATGAGSDAEMSPRKRVRKQQLLTKNDASSSLALGAAAVAAASSLVSGVPTAPVSASPLSIAGRNLQLDFLQHQSGVHLGGGRVAPSSASSVSTASRQLVYQPNFSMAPINPSARNEGWFPKFYVSLLVSL